MDKLIRETLGGITPPPLLSDMTRAVKVLEVAGATTYETELMQLYSTRDNVDLDDLNLGTQAILHAALDVIFMDHGIVISYEANELMLKTDIALGLLRLADLEHPEDIGGIVGDDSLSNSEMLAEAIHFYMDRNYSVEDVLFKIESMNPDIIDRIKELVKTKSSLSDEAVTIEDEIRDNLIVNKCLERTKAFLATTGVRKERAVVTRMAKEHIKPGYPMSYYLDYLTEALDDVNNEDYEQIAELIVGVALYSYDDLSLTAKVRSAAEVIYEDLRDIDGIVEAAIKYNTNEESLSDAQRLLQASSIA